MNIDDISITDYKDNSGVEEIKSLQWMSYSTLGGLVVETSEAIDVEIYSMDAVKVYGSIVGQGKTIVSLEKGVYIVVAGDEAKKVIVK